MQKYGLIKFSMSLLYRARPIITQKRKQKQKQCLNGHEYFRDLYHSLSGCKRQEDKTHYIYEVL